MYDYEEACPVSKAAQVLCERWTLQIIREMLMGATRFNEFRQYLPRLSPTLLKARLKMLEENGIVVRRKIAEKRGHEYQLTPSGKALRPVIVELGKWGMEWVFHNMDPTQLNISAIVRDYALALRTDELPGGGATIQMNVTGSDQPVKKYILVREGTSQVCDENIGYDVDVYLTADLETLGKIWYGKLDVATACEKKLLKVVGMPYCVRTVSRWNGTSQFAPNSRMTPDTAPHINN